MELRSNGGRVFVIFGGAALSCPSPPPPPSLPPSLPQCESHCDPAEYVHVIAECRRHLVATHVRRSLFFEMCRKVARAAITACSLIPLFTSLRTAEVRRRSEPLRTRLKVGSRLSPAGADCRRSSGISSSGRLSRRDAAEISSFRAAGALLGWDGGGERRGRAGRKREVSLYAVENKWSHGNLFNNAPEQSRSSSSASARWTYRLSAQKAQLASATELPRATAFKHRIISVYIHEQYLYGT